MKRLRALLVLLAAVGFAAASLGAGTFADLEPVVFPVIFDRLPFDPPTWTLSIWGVILLWFVAHGLNGLLRRANDPLWDSARTQVFLSLSLGIGLFAFGGGRPRVACGLLLLMAIAAFWALARSKRAQDDAWRIDPIALYAGWLTALFPISVGILIVGYGIASVDTTAYWLLFCIAASGILLGASLDSPPAYSVGVIWPLIGILSINLDNTAMMIATGLATLAVAVPAVRRELLNI